MLLTVHMRVEAEAAKAKDVQGSGAALTPSAPASRASGPGQPRPAQRREASSQPEGSHASSAPFSRSSPLWKEGCLELGTVSSSRAGISGAHGRGWGRRGADGDGFLQSGVCVLPEAARLRRGGG